MHHLAQLNIAKMRYPLEDERMAGFTNRLDEINALAERSPGFVWRFISDNNNATSVRPFDEMTIVNLSVWKDLASLRSFAFRTDHAELYRDRKQWFESAQEANAVLWWVAVGETPTVEEAKARLLRI